MKRAQKKLDRIPNKRDSLRQQSRALEAHWKLFMAASATNTPVALPEPPKPAPAPRVKSDEDVTPPMLKLLNKLVRGQVLRWSETHKQYELLRSTPHGSTYRKVRQKIVAALLRLELIARGFNRFAFNIVNAGRAVIGLPPLPTKRIILLEKQFRHASPVAEPPVRSASEALKMGAIRRAGA